jgi:hypothetical protein
MHAAIPPRFRARLRCAAASTRNTGTSLAVCFKDLSAGQRRHRYWMRSVNMTRPRMIFPKSRDSTVSRAGSKHDYEIYATYRRTTEGAFIGLLKVVRKTDGRLLFPFAGAPDIGPFENGQEAREAAQRYGEGVVDADLENPEA